MILKEIEIERFLSHRRTSLNLESGVIAIVGPNGAGKSSIIDAISFAIFGVPVSRSVRRKVDLIQRGAREAKVTVKFSKGREEIQIERSLSATSQGYAYLKICNREGCRILAKGNSKVTEEVVKLFGLEEGSQNVLKELLFVPQGKLTELVDMTSSNRREFVEKLLRLRELKVVKEKLGDVITNKYLDHLSELKVRKKTILEKINELERLRKEYSSLSEKFSELSNKLNLNKTRLIEVKTSLEELERLREKYNLMNAKHRDILNKIDELRRRKEELDKELRELLHGKDLLQMKNLRDQLRDEYERLESLVRYFESAQNLIKLKLELKELEGSEEKLRELEREISGKEELLRKLREDLENITQDLGNLDPTIKELEILENARKRILMLLESYPSIDELKGQVEKTSMEIEEIERKLKQREEEIAYMQALISELKEKIDKLKGSSICPVCGRPLSPEERDRKIKEYSNELNVLQSRLSTYYSEYKKLKVRLEELWSLRERLKSKYDSIQAILNSFSVENLDELNQNIFQLYFIISSIAENNVTTIEEARRVRSKLVRRRDELNEKIKALDREIREIQRQKENLLGRVVKRNKILEEIRKIESILPSDPQEIIDSYSKYAEVKRKLVELEDKVQKASNIRSRIEEIEERLKPLLREEESLREEINQLGFNEDEYNKLKELYEKLTDEITQLEKEVSATNRLLQEYKKRLDEIESLRNEMKVIDLEIIKVESFVQFLRTLRKDLSDKIPSKLMNYLRENWNIEASNILRSFETSISNVYIDENWNVIAYSPLGEIDVGMLSGGEKVSVALALKLALLRLFTETPIQFMILDEPTIYLDSERKKALKEIIMDASRKSIEQLIVVTHDREIVDVANKVIEVSKKGALSEVEVAKV